MRKSCLAERVRRRKASAICVSHVPIGTLLRVAQQAKPSELTLALALQRLGEHTFTARIVGKNL